MRPPFPVLLFAQKLSTPEQKAIIIMIIKMYEAG